jgi:hypothetical protein
MYCRTGAGLTEPSKITKEDLHPSATKPEVSNELLWSKEWRIVSKVVSHYDARQTAFGRFISSSSLLDVHVLPLLVVVDAVAVHPPPLLEGPSRSTQQWLQ